MSLGESLYSLQDGEVRQRGETDKAYSITAR